MDQRDLGQLLAALVARPLAFSTVVMLLGAATFGVSLALPVGVTAVAIAALGAFATGAAALTLLLLGVGEAAGLSRRSSRATREGRSQMVFAGGRPPSLYLKPRPRYPEPIAAHRSGTPNDIDIDIDITVPAPRHTSAAQGSKRGS